MAVIKGQNLRLFVGNSALPVALATSCSIHISARVSDVSSKDDDALWRETAVLGLQWEATVDALLSSSGTAFSIGDAFTAKFYTTSGAHNQTKQSLVCSGPCVVTDLQLVGEDGQYSTWRATLTGTGSLATS